MSPFYHPKCFFFLFTITLFFFLSFSLCYSPEFNRNLKRSTCYHKKGENAKCHVSGNFYMFTYGAIEIILSQCPNLEKATFLSIIAAVTSLVYSSIALCLSIAKIFSHRKFKGNLMVLKAGVDVASSKKIWHAFQALGNIAFAYTYSMMLLEIQVFRRNQKFSFSFSNFTNNYLFLYIF